MENMFNQEKVSSLYPQCDAMYEAMRIWSLPKGKEHLLQEKCESGEYFGQIKKDGFFYQYVAGDTESYLFSRNESKATGLLTEKLANVPHIAEALKELPRGTTLIGEVYVPGGTSKDTTRIMGCLPEAAIERQNEEGSIHYYLHDIISFNGVSMIDMTATKRYSVLEKLYQSFNLDKYSFIELAEVYTDNLFERIGLSLENGEEGMVLKHRNAPYSPGKKPAWSAIKCKKVDYADVVCMGFEDPTKEYTGTELDTWGYWIIEQESECGKGDWSLYQKHTQAVIIKSPLFRTIPVTKPYYYGWKTSIKIGAYDNSGNLKEIGTVSSGITDELRKDFAINPNKYIGETMMVQCMEKDTKSHTMRHPIYKGFRIDKNSKECTLEEIF